VNPLELASRYVVPSVMRRLVEVLVEEHGLSRVEVARRTGLSPAAVTRYLKGERGSALDVRGIGELDGMIRELAREVASGSVSAPRLQAKVAGVAAHAMAKGYFCGFHAELDPRFGPATCSACREVFRPGASA
jgi:predicted transcriptional regulator